MTHFTAQNQYVIQDGSKFKIDPQGLNVIWGADDRYWKIDKNKGGPAELVQVCWLEVTGKIPVKKGSKLEPGTEYKLVFNLELKADAFGWKESPVHFMVKPSKTKGRIWRRCDLTSAAGTSANNKTFKAPWDEKKGPVLTFRVPLDAPEGDEVSFGMYEIWKGTWKGGLIIHSVEVEPVAKT